ncbi:MAG: macrolide ABC transporter ATP-binding protein [Candidatus Kerfeldbacteria bacterium RIFCSPHIGHO2_02_FULL_42_14]|uniref:Macrolide ABC transporter ATP-binding protein n=1 Tax=Candidatus Kerfeldbacteria bacterium RIFCSPHIGHO2_02_FULL_42_14 TaxID=1798540 RepID=A0A1G2AR65_9BACT|nr:MAG: macrolide ABC transporter ATP-binding protein [Candidatus Kerfeldbacteria bacterium RIFCSPHIGHO2_02_FULL_42_14]OGY80672.1 MAG: macrolide ABC transporter ATP-binding protein [Candidatus Kerfeldbacteria bacterium RIFCSPHIGHO2_12_FULL_42_13]OGY82599.1 MAG: macrolide ABC transporter ATP-binding protein [Candidatus Kerfeldbacteria bacterium RIFCSPLOWO2_02_FULL_42_19]OGY85202.1 MAG: macrolide ABC transporter ATP-binding protein [Candidatus Kerfeldbacteria bacterium RIFCSPLOWO2_12_FULL_43_9]
MSEILKLKNVSKTYRLTKQNNVEALKNINININKGEFVAIMGPSGSGKSSLLHVIGLLDKPESGEIVIDDHNIADLNSKEMARIRLKTIGFVFQTFNLLPRLSAFKNVLLPAIYGRQPRGTAKERAKQLLEQVGLGERMKHKPNELSGGEKQRVAIARALTNNPTLILADEPTGNLDSHSGKEIMKIFKQLQKEGRTIIVVTHDAEIAKEAERIICLKDGKIVRS